MLILFVLVAAMGIVLATIELFATIMYRGQLNAVRKKKYELYKAIKDHQKRL
jgi:hypothetical protein